MTRKRIIDADGNEQTVYYENAEDTNTVTKFTVNGKTITSHSKNDSFGRKVFDELQLGTGFVSRQFSYHVGAETQQHKDNEKLKSSATTQLVSQITLSGGRTISYKYDKEERITEVDDSVDGITTYTYDALGQLLTETVIKDGVSTVVNEMTYSDSNQQGCYGNILSKNGVVYEYDTVWKDKLVKVGDDTITYDAQGNPTSYLGNQMEWEKGRQLKKLTKPDGTVIDYTYNANGIRTSKTIGGIRHDFVLDGAKILRETWNGNTLTPLYDNEDSVCGIVYNNAPYYFQKNLQGDVIAITDANGHTVARYIYDAWGVCTVKQDISTCGIATINPFRYRGYYYDTEIGMYYLQSRYYDPVVGRFVNADDSCFAFLGNGVLTKNLYLYCENCVVVKVDHSGFTSTTYGGITCSQAKKGFSVKMHAKFLLKSFCKKYAEHVISTWGENNKYCGMNATRIAAEIFGHAILYVLGIVIGVYSIWNLAYAKKARSFLSKKMGIIRAAISGYVAHFLINKSKKIDVNSDESWYRVAAFWAIWLFFAPVVW